MAHTDSILWHPQVTVEKWNPETVREIQDFLGHEPTPNEFKDLGVAPDDYAYAEGNALVDVGKTRLALLITGSGQAFTTARGVVGVGTSNTATTGGMTALQGTAYYQALSAGPTPGTGTISASAAFASGEANHAWEEWCWAIATATPVPSTSFTTATTTGVMFNRKVQSLGTKAVGAVWTHTAVVTVS